MRSLEFAAKTWEEYEELRVKNRSAHKTLRRLLKQMLRTPIEGDGKPEALKHEVTARWSRRLNKKDRVIYTFSDDTVTIVAIQSHYGQK